MEQIVALCRRRGFIFQSSEIYGGLNGFWDYGPLGHGAQAERPQRLVPRHGHQPRRVLGAARAPQAFSMVGIESSIIMHPQVWKCSRPLRPVHRHDGRLPRVQGPLPCRPRQDQRMPAQAEQAPGRIREVQAHRAARIQPDVQDDRSGPSPAKRGPPSCGPRRRRGCSSISRTCSTARASKCRSASRKSARASATRSRRATSPSAPASSSRWRWSSSAIPASRGPGTSTGATAATTGTSTWASPRRTCSSATTRPKSCRTTPAARPTSNTRIPFLDAGRIRRAGRDRPSRRFRPALAHGRQAGQIGQRPRRRDKAPTAIRATAAAARTSRYFDDQSRERFVPHVIEPAAGADRGTLAFLCEAYHEDEQPDEKGELQKRVVMRFHPKLAPIKVAVFPLIKKEGMPEAALAIYRELKEAGIAMLLRSAGGHRPPLPPPGRNRHAVLHHGRRRHGQRRHRHHPRPRHAGPGSRAGEKRRRRNPPPHAPLSGPSAKEGRFGWSAETLFDLPGARVYPLLRRSLRDTLAASDSLTVRKTVGIIRV